MRQAIYAFTVDIRQPYTKTYMIGPIFKKKTC